MSKEQQVQVYEMLSVLFLTLSKGEQVQQCIREVLTSHPFFSPMTLFKYISKNTSAITKEHLLQFLEDNKETVQEEEVKAIIQFEQKQQWQYKDFIEYVYPFNSAVLREITNMHLKRYTKLENYSPPESSLAGFLLLLTEHLALIRKLQTQKSDSLQNISKQRLRKILLSIKKAGEKQHCHCENDATRITSLELRNFMRAFVSVEDSHFLYLSRQIGLKNGYVLIDNLEKLLKPSKRSIKKGMNHKGQKGTPKKLLDREEQFNEKQYKEELMQQLAHQVSEKSVKKNTYGLRQNSIYENSITKRREERKGEKQKIAPQAPMHDNYFMHQAHKQPPRTTASAKELLVSFVQYFLPISRRLEELKAKLAQHKLDYFKLFKLIDRSGRGVIGAEDLQQYYSWAGGLTQFKPQDFELVIERYAQSEQPWITLTEFCEMVRTDDKETINRTPPNLADEVHQTVVKIIEVTIQGETNLLTIRKQFRKQESVYLFNLINREQTGFINYQELKKFLTEAGLQLSMHDLMAVLKRLDRSRNGVVVQNEFVSYFRPPHSYL